MCERLKRRLSDFMDNDPLMFYAFLIDSGCAEDILNFLDGEKLSSDEKSYIGDLLADYE